MEIVPATSDFTPRAPTISHDSRKRCWRITNIPKEWDKNRLLGRLQEYDGSLKDWELCDDKLSLYPDCYRSDRRTALLNLEECPVSEVFRDMNLEEENFISSTDGTGKVFNLIVDCRFNDLTPLNSPEGEVLIDVVAVTGLAGHAFGSWRNRSSRAMWLKDFLGEDIKTIRIMTYGYNTSLTGISPGFTKMASYRDNFREQLENVRTEDKKRPIIFIGHSVGGLMVLQTLLQSKLRSENPLLPNDHILESTHAIFFFGTPHQGFDTSQMRAMILDIHGDLKSTCSILETKMRFLEQLESDSEFLETQHAAIIPILSSCKVFSFYESAETRIIGKIDDTEDYSRVGDLKIQVKPFSAKLNMLEEVQVVVHKNHTEMVKFSGQVDVTYLSVVKYLRGCEEDINKLREESKKPQQHICTSEEVAGIFKTLNYIDFQSKRNDILSSKHHPDTSEWIFDYPEYREWIRDENPSLLWIHGVPGCGKTVLLSFLSEKLAKDTKISNGKPPLVVYTFCDDKDTSLAKDVNILQNLLYQLLKEERGFFQHIWPEYRLYEEKTQWTFGNLWLVFERIINSTESDSRAIFLLIDALDECEEESRERLLDKLHELFQNHRSSKKNFKMVITSRSHIPVIEGLPTPTSKEISLNARNLSQDIERFVDAEVSSLATKHKLSDELKSEIQETLIKNAEGMFLWVSLTIYGLKQLKRTGPQSIRKALKGLPKGLPALYESILAEIKDEEDQEDARKILQWVVCVAYPLQLHELKVAITVRPEHTSISSMKEDDRIGEDFEGFLKSLFGPLLRISLNHVYLAHQSVKDFLTNPDLAKTFFVSLNKGSLQLGITCLNYLSFDDLEVASEVASGEHKFLFYSATKWPKHIEHHKDDPQLLESFLRLAESSKRLNAAFELNYGAAPLEYTTPLQIAAYFGLSSAVEKFLKEGVDINTCVGSIGSALYEGIAARDEAVIRILLERGVDINKSVLGRLKYSDGDTSNGQREEYSALRAAVEFSNKSVVGLLLDYLDTPTPVTAELLVGVVSNKRLINARENLEFLLCLDKEIQIPQCVLENAAKLPTQEIIEVLLPRVDKDQITELVLIEVAKNASSGAPMIEILVKAGFITTITESVLIQVARNTSSGGRMMEVLCGTGLIKNITDSVLIEVGKNLNSGVQIMEALRKADLVEVTDRVLIWAALSPNPLKTMKILLNEPGKTRISDMAIETIARDHGPDYMELLLKASTDGIFPVTERILEQAARNRWHGKEVLEVLERVGPITVTSAMVEGAVANERSGKEVIGFLLEKTLDNKLPVSEAALIQAAKSRNPSNLSIMQLILDTSASPIKITDAVIREVLENYYSLEGLMELLWKTVPGSKVPIAQKTLLQAVEDRGAREGLKVLKFLLRNSGNITIFDSDLEGMIESHLFTRNLTAILLRTPPGNEVAISESTLLHAMRNYEWGGPVMDFLLSRRTELQITEKVARLAKVSICISSMARKRIWDMFENTGNISRS